MQPPTTLTVFLCDDVNLLCGLHSWPDFTSRRTYDERQTHAKQQSNNNNHGTHSDCALRRRTRTPRCLKWPMLSLVILTDSETLALKQTRDSDAFFRDVFRDADDVSIRFSFLLVAFGVESVD